jgi:hypothetical protein
MFVLRTLQHRATGPADAGAERGAALVLASVLVGLTIAVATGWRCSRPIADLWRQSVIGALSVFGASLLSLVCLPLDLVVGRIALVLYASMLLVGSVAAAAAARRSGAQ